VKTKVLLISLALLLVISLVAGCAAPTPTPTPTPTPKPVVLTAVTVFPVVDENMDTLNMLIDKVKETSNGQLIIDFKGGPEVIGAFDQGEAVRKGVIDLSFLYSAAYGGLVPGEGLFSVSPLTPEEERQSGFYDLMVELHKKYGLMYLGKAPGADGVTEMKMGMWLKKPIEKPQDLAGFKIGGVSPLCNAFFTKLGATSHVLNTVEIYTALDRNIVDGAWYGLVGPVTFGWMEVVNYYIDRTFYNDNCVFIMNLEAWNNLPKGLQDALIEAVKYVEHEGPISFNKYYERDKQAMRDKGIKFIKFSPEDEKWFLDACYTAEYENQLTLNPDVSSRAKELWDKFRK